MMKELSPTAAKIADIAEHFIQSRGYNGFSFRDIQDALGIKTASIHYHFKTKQDLSKITLEFNNKKDQYEEKLKKNIKLLSDAKNIEPNKLTACVLKRPRHNDIIKNLNEMGVSIKYISDGDVSGVISVAKPPTNIDIYLGIGGGPEGVLAAAALKCMGCQMQTRLFFQNSNEEERAKKLGIKDLGKKYNIEDMVKDDVIFCATGVTDGDLVNGIKDLGDTFKSETLVLHKSSKTNTIIRNEYKK